MSDLKKGSKAVSFIEVIAAGVLWGCMGLFVRNLNSLGLATMGIVAVRCFITCLLIFIYLLVQAVFFKKNMLKIKLKDIWCFIGTGLCSILFFNFCYFKTMTLTSLSVAAILLYTSPAFIMVMSFFLFKEKFNKNKIISLVMTFAGCVLVSGLIDVLVSGGTMNLSGKGLLLGLGAGFGYALYSIFSRFAIERGYNSLTITFYTFLFASVGSLFLTNLKELATVFTGSAKGCLLCIGISIFATLIPYITYTAGLKGMDNGSAAVVVSIEPAVATLVSLIVYREPMTVFGAIGVLLVLGAIIIVNMPAKNKKTA